MIEPGDQLYDRDNRPEVLHSPHPNRLCQPRPQGGTEAQRRESISHSDIRQPSLAGVGMPKCNAPLQQGHALVYPDEKLVPAMHGRYRTMVAERCLKAARLDPRKRYREGRDQEQGEGEPPPGWVGHSGANSRRAPDAT